MKTIKGYNAPFADELPPLSTEEREALKADIAEHGQLDPIYVDEENNILDGHNRLTLADEPWIEVIDWFESDDQKRAFVMSRNFKRRNLSPSQKAEVRERMKATAKALREEDAKHWTQPRIATMFGVSQQVVSVWQSEWDANPRTNTKTGNSSKPDARVKLNDAAKKQAVERVESGETQTQVAADLGVSQKAISKVVQAEKKKEEKKKQLAAKASKAKQEGKPDWRVIHGNCVEELPKLANKSARLIFADPPYNIGIDYGPGENADLLDENDYLNWCQEWINLCANVLADDGSMWVMINDEWADCFGVMLRDAGLHRRAWVKWYETFGVNCQNNFNRCSRHIFYCVADPKHFVFNPEAVKRESDRQAKYNDKRAVSDGKIWDDVWQIPRLTGTCDERMPEFPTQVPLEITRAIVGCASEPGDLVVDPFNGSGSTGAAALEQGRRYIGIEQEERFCEAARQRLLGI